MSNAGKGGPGTNQHQVKPGGKTSDEVMADSAGAAFAGEGDDPFGEGQAPEPPSEGTQNRRAARESLHEARKAARGVKVFTNEEKVARLEAAIDGANSAIGQIDAARKSYGLPNANKQVVEVVDGETVWELPKVDESVAEDNSPRALRKAGLAYLEGAERDLRGREGLDEGQRAERLASAKLRAMHGRNFLIDAKDGYLTS